MIFFLLSCSTQEASLEITWLGVTTVLLETEKSAILLDPFFSRPVYNQEGSTKEGLELFQEIMSIENRSRLDAIVVSHSHFDHAIDAGVVALETGAQVYGSKTTCFITQSQGLSEDRCTIVESLQPFDIGEVNIIPIRTAHWWSDAPEGIAGNFKEYTEIPDPEDVSAAPSGGMYSYFLGYPQANLFYQASMDAIDEPDGSNEDFVYNFDQMFSTERSVDVWMLCGDCLTEQSDVEAYVAYIKPKNSLFMHWDAPNPLVVHGLEEGVPIDFSPSVPYLNALQASEIWVPSQYFEKYQYASQTLQKVDSPLQKHFFNTP